MATRTGHMSKKDIDARLEFEVKLRGDTDKIRPPSFFEFTTKKDIQRFDRLLARATIDDAEVIWKVQIESFGELLKKYQDMDTNPGNEPIEKVKKRLNQPFTKYKEQV